MGESFLDRPVWQALATRQRDLAVGRGRALRFAPDISPLAGAGDDAPESLAALAALVPDVGTLMLMQADEIRLPSTLAAEKTAFGVQMVAVALTDVEMAAQIEPLSGEDAPAMLALATLAAPGPFLAGTHRLGGFIGIKEKGRLVAMAGERLKLPGMTEVSGVCTHPDARGRGYARMLSAAVAGRIAAAGEMPFLHVYADNAAAIALYESLGFQIRCRVNVALVRRG